MHEENIHIFIHTCTKHNPGSLKLKTFRVLIKNRTHQFNLPGDGVYVCIFQKVTVNLNSKSSLLVRGYTFPPGERGRGIYIYI